MLGFFDSGVGGLSVWREVASLLPDVPSVYLADEAHCPYGGRDAAEIIARSRANTKKLLELGAKVIVVACNTATAAAIDTLRREFPHVPFVGMEPAIKVAAAQTRSGVVAVLATEGTFKGRLWRETCARCAADVKVLKSTAPEFVEIVESGECDSPRAVEAVRRKVEPLVAAGADQIVLGCTHFPFLAAQIASVAGPGVAIVDPSPAVARRVAAVLQPTAIDCNRLQSPVRHTFLTTGEPSRFARLLAAMGVSSATPPAKA